MRRSRATVDGFARRTIARVSSMNRLSAEWRPELSWLVDVAAESDASAISRLRLAGVGNVYGLHRGGEPRLATPGPWVSSPGCCDVRTNDVVAIEPYRSEVQVLFRETDLHHSVFLTNQCNSRCLMCSQPPTTRDDSWLVDEAKTVAAHIATGPAILGFTGGEPLLLGEKLRAILDVYCEVLPTTHFEVLTNGRLLCDGGLARALLEDLPRRVFWMVPLYGNSDDLHDHVVQSLGAFDQTISGLLNLHSYSQPVQLRIVLIEPVLEAIGDLCAFVTKNLPFVREVALMGCEPTGLALANRAVCEVDIRKWEAEVSDAVRVLTRSHVRPVLMNVPLCALPRSLWPLAHRSISDWKQVYANECASCRAKNECCGLFAWHERGWPPTSLRPQE